MCSPTGPVGLIAKPVALFDLDKVREATQYVQSLPEGDRDIVRTWLVTEGLLAGLYYILLFLVVFLLGRRIIQAMIAAYREAKAESV